MVKAGSMEELEERTEKVRIIGKTHNMDIVPHSYRQLDALNTSLPTGARFVDTMRTITSEELSIFIPFMECSPANDVPTKYWPLGEIPLPLMFSPRVLNPFSASALFGNAVNAAIRKKKIFFIIKTLS